MQLAWIDNRPLTRSHGYDTVLLPLEGRTGIADMFFVRQPVPFTSDNGDDN